MDTESRRTSPSLTHSTAHALFENGHDFSFFQAVRLLNRIYPRRNPVGGDSRPDQETVRFRQHLSLEFPPSAIHQIEHNPKGQPQMTVAFLGLVGRQGILPLHYTEQLLRRRYERKDTAALAFLDLFHHRLASFFYRAWEKHRLPVQYEQEHAGRQPRERGLTQYLYDLIGLGTKGLRQDARAVPDRSLLLYAGLIAQRPHSSAALEGMLHDYFRVPVWLEQFRGKWFALADSELSYLRDEGIHNRLGEGAVAGEEIFCPQAMIRLHFGPLKWRRFRAFLPGGSAFLKLPALTRIFIDRSLDFDIQLTLLAADVPAFQLTDEGPDAPALGLSTWLKTEPFTDDAHDVILSNSFQEAA